LISVYISQKRDISVMLSLFGCLGSEAKAPLKKLRTEEEERLERLKRECCA
jgi:hypothetical protein